MLGSSRTAVGTKQISVQREDLKWDPGSQPPTIRPPGLRPPLSALSRPRPTCPGFGHRPLAFCRVARLFFADYHRSEVSFPFSWSSTSSYG